MPWTQTTGRPSGLPHSVTWSRATAQCGLSTVAPGDEDGGHQLVSSGVAGRGFQSGLESFPSGSVSTDWWPAASMVTIEPSRENAIVGPSGLQAGSNASSVEYVMRLRPVPSTRTVKISKWPLPSRAANAIVFESGDQAGP